MLAEADKEWLLMMLRRMRHEAYSAGYHHAMGEAAEETKWKAAEATADEIVTWLEGRK